MTDWQSIVPRSAWSILGSGPSPELYPVYLDVLLALYGTTTRYTTGLGLPYEQARATADLVIEEHGIYQTLPEDEFYDPELESDLSVSHGAKVLRRLERAGWLRREWDQITGNNMVRFPAFAFVVLSGLAELQEVESVESDTVLVSILDILTDERVQKRQAIRQAHHLMARLIEAAQSTAHQLASWSPQVERLRPYDLSSWVAGYRGSQAEQEYLRFKLRHSPDRWHAEITAVVNDLQENISRIVADSVGKGGVLTPHPTPDDVARTASEVAASLRFILDGLNRLHDMVNEMDNVHRQLLEAYSRQVNIALSSSAASAVIEAVQRLLAALPLSKRGDVQVPGLAWARLRAMPHAASSLRYQTRREQEPDFVASAESQTPVEEIDSTFRPGPQRVEAHFRQVFGDLNEMTVAALLGDRPETAEWVSRLLDYAGLDDFEFQVVVPDGGAVQKAVFVPLPDVETPYRIISNVTIRRRTSLSGSAREPKAQ